MFDEMNVGGGNRWGDGQTKTQKRQITWNGWVSGAVGSRQPWTWSLTFK